MNALGLLLTLVFVVMILRGSRSLALLGLFGVVCYVPENQQVLIAGFHFSAMRFALLAAFVKVLARRDFEGLTLTGIDKVLVAYGLGVSAISILREGTFAEVVFCFGKDYDMFLAYFICRCLLRSYEDVKSLFFPMAWLILPLSILMTRETVSAANPFDVMGLEHDIDIRHGVSRAQGPFQSPILAGVFGATLVPIFLGLYALKKRRFVLLAGIAAASLITVTTISSAPILALFLVFFCAGCWPIRERMRTVRWLIVAMLVGLQIVMKGEVWFIFGHLAHLTGGGGEYRSELIDSAIRNVGQWWLLGFKDTGQWTANHLANGTADITNQYIRDAVDGGLLGLILLITLLTKCLGQLGKARKAIRFELVPSTDETEEWFLWCLGCALVTHIVTILSVEYFDQIKVSWFMLLAIISSLTSEVLNRRPSVENNSEIETALAARSMDDPDGMMNAARN